jgi:hypothetical protein
MPNEGEDSRHLAIRIEEAVAALADESATDWWQARRRAATGETPSLHGPDAGSWRRSWSLDDRKRTRRGKRDWPEV